MSNNTSPQIQPLPTTTYKFLPNDLGYNLVVILFSAFTILNSITLIVNFYIFYLLNKNSQTPSNEMLNDFVNTGNLYNKLAFWLLILFIICAFAFLFWLYRANNNAHALHPEKKFEFTPAWSVGSYFIPILFLYWPYKALKEIWFTTIANNSSLLQIWWLTFLMMTFARKYLNTLSVHAISDMQTYNLISTIHSLSAIISTSAAILIIIKIQQSQKQATTK